MIKSLSEFRDIKDMEIAVITDLADNQISVWNQSSENSFFRMTPLNGRDPILIEIH